MKKEYDFLLVGAGLFNAVFAYQAKLCGKRCLVIEKRKHLGGNVYCEDFAGITVHKYGPHIFHTNDDEVWRFVNQFITFDQYTLNTIANYRGKLYNLPFNMHTFYQMWGVLSPQEAGEILEKQRNFVGKYAPHNFEEQAICLVGEEIYKTLVKGYTEKQWGRPCSELPADIIKRLPVRFTFNNNYFDDRYQGIPNGGYNILIQRLLSGIECHTGCDYLLNRGELDGIADKIIYTGSIDEFFDYTYGRLMYRSLRFEKESLNIENYQGNAIVNYTEKEIPYTRIVEYKWFDLHNSSVRKAPYTVITREFPIEFTNDSEPYYPINDKNNTALHTKYLERAKIEHPNVLFAGRIGAYKYLNMDDVIKEALIYSSILCS